MLTSCDYRDNFPPPMFAYFKPAAQIPGAFKVLLAPMRFRAPRRLPFAFGWLVKRPIDRDAEDSYVLAGMAVPGVTDDVKKVVKGFHKRFTNEAADRLGEFTKPALIAWSRDDRFFKPAHAERLAHDLGNARLEWIEDARTFSSEDQPGRLAELIAGFVREPARVCAAQRPAAAPGYPSRSTIIAWPCPPATHMVSRPTVLSSVSRPLSSVVMIRAPVMPKGWPRAIAPPCGFIFSSGMSHSSMIGITWAAKASFSST